MKYFIPCFILYCISELYRTKKAKIYYVKKLPYNYNAICIPPFGIFIKSDQASNRNLIIHELIHWEQYRKIGLLNYIYYNLVSNYDNNILEIEARFNENEFCKKNYTFCVRNGLAKTVYNKNFRR